MTFPGFPSDLFAFLSELKDNNERAWFEANKARFETSVRRPLQDFVLAFAPRLTAISPHFVADPKKSLFRIHRDVRFSKDKSPYKTTAAIHFRHAAGKDAHAPGFYLHLEPGQVFYGAGLWKPPSEPLGAIRAAIDADAAGWRAATNDPAFQAIFGGLREGDPLSRPPRGYAADHPHLADLKKRSFFAIVDAAETDARAPAFLSQVDEAYAAAAPVMAFLTRAVGAPF